MRIVVTSGGAGLDVPTSPAFGRCPVYVFVDTESMTFDALENSAVAAPSGAGIQAAQLVVEHGAEAVVTGSVGPNAFTVLQAAGTPVYLFAGGSVREAAEAFRTGQLQSIAEASARAGTGMSGGMGRGRGMGRGMGRRMQPGFRGIGSYGPAVPAARSTATPGTEPEASLEDEAAALREMAGQLQQQLSEVLERLGRLEAAD